MKKVNTCQLGSSIKRSHNYCNKESNTPRHNVVNDNRDCKPDSSGSASNAMHAQDRALDEAAALFRGNSLGYASVNEVVAVTDRQQDFIGSDAASPDVSNVRKQRTFSHAILSDNMSQLSYISVKISDAPSGGKCCVVNALADFGSEIAVRKHTADFDCAPSAKVQMGAFIGSAVEADIVRLYVSLADSGEDDERCVVVCCAVCDDMREDLILTASVIDKLCTSRANGVTVDPPPRDEDDDADEGDHSGDHADSQQRSETDNDKKVSDSDLGQRDDQGYDQSLLTGAVEKCGRVNNTDTSHICVNTVVDSVLIDTSNSEQKTDGSDVGQSVPADKYDPDGLVDGASSGNVTAEELRKEQLKDETLKGSWRLASEDSGNFFVKNGLPYHNEMMLGQRLEQLCLPNERRKQVVKLAHDTRCKKVTCKNARHVRKELV